MRILYLDFNVQYHNPTRNSIPILLKNVADTIIYGPGYQSQITLDKGIEKFVEKYGPFDFVVTNEHFIFSKIQSIDTIKKGLSLYKNNYYFHFSLINAENIILDIVKYFYKEEKNTKKLVFLMETDYYSLGEHQLELLDRNDFFIVGWGEDLIAHSEQLEDLQKEIFATKVNNNWFNFVKNNNRMIQFTHFVNSSEFYFECLSNRENIIDISGANYYHRKMALNVIQNSEYKINKKFYKVIFPILRRLGMKPDGNPILLKLYNILFKYELEKAKYIFTCGSGLEWPIRKFFEIPATGTLLLAKPFYNSEKLGFKENINYIKTDFNNLLETIRTLESGLLLDSQEIANKGQELVRKKHSLEARSQKLEECLKSILINNFDGTYWSNGNLCVKSLIRN